MNPNLLKFQILILAEKERLPREPRVLRPTDKVGVDEDPIYAAATPKELKVLTPKTFKEEDRFSEQHRPSENQMYFYQRAGATPHTEDEGTFFQRAWGHSWHYLERGFFIYS